MLTFIYSVGKYTNINSKTDSDNLLENRMMIEFRGYLGLNMATQFDTKMDKYLKTS